MRKLLNEYFCIPKGGKIREKVMLARVATTVLIVVLCLAAMGFTAYAYFSADLTSSPNTLKAANFDIEVSITANGSPVDVNAELKADTEYSVTLTRAENSTGTGYVIMNAADCEDEYVAQFNRDTPTITFTVTPTAETTVSFLVCWGTSSQAAESTYVIAGGATITLTISADADVTEEPAADTADEQEPVTETQKPEKPAESASSEPTQSAGSTEPSVSEPSAPAESTEPEPAEPSAPEMTEPVESEEPTAPEVSEPVESTEPETSSEEPEPDEPTEPAEPETPDEQPESAPESSEGTEAPADEVTDAPVDESADESVE